jgi:hypothetical protein
MKMHEAKREEERGRERKRERERESQRMRDMCGRDHEPARGCVQVGESK